MRSRVQVTISATALRHNLARVREFAPGCRVMAAVKADGYGHGILRVATALQGVDAFAVATLDEALTLRLNGINTPICLLEGFRNADELQQAKAHQFMVVLHSEYQLQLLQQLPLEDEISVWIKVDTGMHRLGFAPAAARDVRQQLQCRTGVRFVGWMTHLANADDPQDEMTVRQLRCFEQATQGQSGVRAIANSAGIVGWPASHSDWVRPGLMLYGASPMVGTEASAYHLRPVMTLSAQLMAINHIPQGDCVGYGGSWSAPEDMAIGVVAIGYGDGYPRHAPSGTPVLLNGQLLPLVGRVSMDMITIDLRGQPEARVGDRVTLWGDGLPIERIAQAAGTIPYELFCKVTARVPVEMC